MPMSAMLSSPVCLLLGECRATPDVPHPALLAAQTTLNCTDVPRQVAADGFVADRPGVKFNAVPAATALNGNRVAVPRVVTDFVQPLAAHGLRRIGLSAAMASTIAELCTSMGRLRFVEGALCSYDVRCRKAELR